MFRERLSAIAQRLDGVAALVLVGYDGIPIESLVFDESLDLEMLAAEIVALVRAIGENHREFDIGPVRSFHVDTVRHSLLLGELVEGYYLLLVLPSQLPLGRARFELRRAPLAFSQDLQV